MRVWRLRRAVIVLVFLLIAVAIAIILTVDPAPRAVKTAAPTPSATSTPKALGLLPTVDDNSPASSKTTLVFSDEFNGSTLDTSKWSTGRYAATTQGDAPFNPSLEGAYYASSQVSESNGNVYLTLAPSTATLNGKTYHYVSGLIQSENHFSLTPGTYIESRTRVNSCQGCWNSIWTQPSGKWPPEIDILEFYPPDGSPKFNFHPASGPELGLASYGEENASYLDAYHTYGLYWDGIHATPYLDGKPYATKPAETRDPMYVIFSLTVLEGYSPPTGSTLAVDWVRVWR
ncbi:glycoside hydrolase family 16 protein [Lacisediminihabitans sp.]|jgi:beta-glucanase (GH16 family)|uniref:glycoside hydrolase family 16 protein n=1 Tax=Lacisediminihabitans sp. TaxID=2787631 RepID=UPI002F9219DC